ncbi:hypothetical protein EDD11_005461 [Mortierella claussenii]|nr:hypothetical protein EDD11_005461 [Mortierella claussenii]
MRFAWFLGHVIVLICAAFYMPYWLSFNYKAGAHWYKRAFLGAMISYGIVAYRSFPQIKFEVQFLQSMLVEENVQYFLMAIFWWRATPMLAPLIPYTIYASLHVLVYLRTTLLPVAYPETVIQPGSASHPESDSVSNAADPKAAQAAGLSHKIEVWIEKNHAAAMAFVAYFEIIGVMGSLILGALTFQSSLLSPIVYANFLRFRYFFSIHTRAAFALLRGRVDALVVGNPKVPPMAVQGYEVVRGAISRFGMAAVQQPVTRTE